MSELTRREFIRSSAILMGLPLVGDFWGPPKGYPLLSFSTLGCPDWSFNKIVSFARSYNYNGIEFRGIQREMDLTKASVFKSARRRNEAISLMTDNDLKFVCLGSSARLHMRKGAERDKNLDEGKRFIDLAEKIGCLYVRVFPNLFPPAQDKYETMNLIAEGLSELRDYAADSRVIVLMETHGDVVRAVDIEKIMQWVPGANIGLIWDIANMWSVTGESPSEAYERLKKYIRHVHIKNGELRAGELRYSILSKGGDVPLAEAIGALTQNGYEGFYSFEWEKLWHPEIEEPEMALADYPTAVQQYFRDNR